MPSNKKGEYSRIVTFISSSTDQFARAGFYSLNERR